MQSAAPWRGDQPADAQFQHLFSTHEQQLAGPLQGWFSASSVPAAIRIRSNAATMHNVHNLHTDDLSQVVFYKQLVLKNVDFEKPREYA